MRAARDAGEPFEIGLLFFVMRGVAQPYELVTGTKVDDWLSMLGYPLPAQIH